MAEQTGRRGGRRSAPATLGALLVLMIAAGIAGVVVGLIVWPVSSSRAPAAQAREARALPALQGWRASTQPCETLLPAAQRPLLLLAMGQSNAGNHAASGEAGDMPLPLLQGGRCGLTDDPLPGASGAGASLWSAVHTRLQGQLAGRPLVWAVIAVDGSPLSQWLGPGPLRHHWERELASLLAQARQQGWPVAAVLWQQGEADARAGRAAQAYADDLRRLQQAMAEHGLDAPWWLAQSGRCPPADGQALRPARERLWREAPQQFKPGPDTDVLGPELRQGCHFNAAGRQAAAALWAQRLQAATW